MIVIYHARPFQLAYSGRNRKLLSISHGLRSLSAYSCEVICSVYVWLMSIKETLRKASMVCVENCLNLMPIDNCLVSERESERGVLFLIWYFFLENLYKINDFDKNVLTRRKKRGTTCNQHVSVMLHVTLGLI